MEEYNHNAFIDDVDFVRLLLMERTDGCATIRAALVVSCLDVCPSGSVGRQSKSMDDWNRRLEHVVHLLEGPSLFKAGFLACGNICSSEPNGASLVSSLGLPSCHLASKYGLGRFVLRVSALVCGPYHVGC